MQQNGGKRSLFKEKVIVCRESIQEAKNADCYINFCSSNILSGNSQHAMLHQIAGTELASECYKFFGTCPTSSRVTSAFDARNFTFIVHTIVPTPLDLGRLIDVKKVYICIRNSLDLAIEEGAKTIAFPSQFPGLSNRITSEIVLRIFTVWIHRNIYSEQLRELKICCENEEEFNMFVQSARSLYEEANVIGNLFVPAFIQQRHAYYQRMSRPRRYRRLYEPAPENAPQVKLELSAKLAPTILVIDDENGMKRQYRLTNKSRDGRKLYFRCSRCDTLIKKDGVQIRAKLIVEDGQIVSERFPRHHPECEGKPLEKVLIQQVDRTSRREVRDGYLLPQDAYKKALDRMRFEARQLGIPVEECFPEWPKLRQQYCRIRKQAIRQRQQEKWEIMMMGKGYMDESKFDFDDYYYQQIQQPRRGRPPKVKSEPLFLPRMRYSPTHNGVVISYDDEEDELYGGEEMAQSSTSGRKRNHVHLSHQEVQPKISEMNVEDQEEEVTIDDRMLLVEQQEETTFEEIEVDME